MQILFGLFDMIQSNAKNVSYISDMTEAIEFSDQIKINPKNGERTHYK